MACLLQCFLTPFRIGGRIIGFLFTPIRHVLHSIQLEFRSTTDEEMLAIQQEFDCIEEPLAPSPFETGGSITTSEASLTEKTSMPQPAPSGIISTAIDDGGAATTTEAALIGEASESEEADNDRTDTAIQTIGIKAMAEDTDDTDDTDFFHRNWPPIITRGITTGDCLHCGKSTEMRCFKCKFNLDGPEWMISYYCSKKCWNDHLSIHEQICSIKRPKRTIDHEISLALSFNESGRIFTTTAYGIMLPENATKPCIVIVTGERCWNDEWGTYVEIYSKEFLGSDGFFVHILENELKPNRKFESTNCFVVYHLSGIELTDNSMPNQCVQAITGGQVAHSWRGPILVIKSLGIVNIEPIDFNLNDDFIDIIDFFKSQKLGTG